MKDSRVKPYLFNKKWFPFAEAAGGINLMMDFEPNENGIYGQIICYIQDPDEIAYVGKTITEIILKIHFRISPLMSNKKYTNHLN